MTADACAPSIATDLGELIIECPCRRGASGITWTPITYPPNPATPPELEAAVAAHRAACEARGPLNPGPPR